MNLDRNKHLTKRRKPNYFKEEPIMVLKRKPSPNDIILDGEVIEKKSLDHLLDDVVVEESKQSWKNEIILENILEDNEDTGENRHRTSQECRDRHSQATLESVIKLADEKVQNFLHGDGDVRMIPTPEDNTEPATPELVEDYNVAINFLCQQEIKPLFKTKLDRSKEKDLKCYTSPMDKITCSATADNSVAGTKHNSTNTSQNKSLAVLHETALKSSLSDKMFTSSFYLDECCKDHFNQLVETLVDNLRQKVFTSFEEVSRKCGVHDGKKGHMSAVLVDTFTTVTNQSIMNRQQEELTADDLTFRIEKLLDTERPVSPDIDLERKISELKISDVSTAPKPKEIVIGESKSEMHVNTFPISRSFWNLGNTVGITTSMEKDNNKIDGKTSSYNQPEQNKNVAPRIIKARKPKSVLTKSAALPSKEELLRERDPEYIRQKNMIRFVDDELRKKMADNNDESKVLYQNKRTIAENDSSVYEFKENVKKVCPGVNKNFCLNFLTDVEVPEIKRTGKTGIVPKTITSRTYSLHCVINGGSSKSNLSDKEYKKWLKKNNFLKYTTLTKSSLSSLKSVSKCPIMSVEHSPYQNFSDTFMSQGDIASREVNTTHAMSERTASFETFLEHFLYEHVVVSNTMNMWCSFSAKRTKKFSGRQRMYQCLLLLGFYVIFLVVKCALTGNFSKKIWL